MLKMTNLMEEIASTLLDDILDQEDMCNCGRCRLDVLAKTLNNIPANYVVNERGKAFSRAEFLELQKSVDIYAALAAAIRIVKENPRH